MFRMSIKRINPIQIDIVIGLTSLIALYIVFFWLNFVLIVRDFGNLPDEVAVGDQPFLWIIFPAFTIISPPILAVLTFILTIVAAAIYNFIAQYLKGIEVITESSSRKTN